MWEEEDFLALSGIQHYDFCPRQWALIHIEQQWSENLHTVQGALMHENAHSGTTEKRGAVYIVRGLPVFSRTLGVRGVCDVVEFAPDENGVALAGRQGKFSPVPVEYKKGRPKTSDADRLQICAQAICLEEMLCCGISEGFLYYGEPRRRTPVVFDEELRQKVRDSFLQMHRLYGRGHTPQAKPGKQCRACSLEGLCLPKLKPTASVKRYMRQRLEEDEPCGNS